MIAAISVGQIIEHTAAAGGKREQVVDIVNWFTLFTFEGCA
jgi:hypothetical protein